MPHRQWPQYKDSRGSNQRKRWRSWLRTQGCVSAKPSLPDTAIQVQQMLHLRTRLSQADTQITKRSLWVRERPFFNWANSIACFEPEPSAS